jgi:thymidylate kinase
VSQLSENRIVLIDRYIDTNMAYSQLRVRRDCECDHSAYKCFLGDNKGAASSYDGGHSEA